MRYNRRKNIRLPEYDYSQEGGYYITICMHARKCSLSCILELGECERAVVKCTEWGSCVESALMCVASQHGVIVDSYVIMPNHIHAIVFFDKSNGCNISLGRFVGAVKSVAANQWIKECKKMGTVAGELWQRNYYEHILRNDMDYLEKRKYIEDNPDKWKLDDEFAEY